MSPARSTIVLSCATALIAGYAAFPSAAQTRGGVSKTSVTRKKDVNANVSKAAYASGRRLSASQGGDGGLAGAPLINEGFEAFTLGPVDGQMGWTCFLADQFVPVVSNTSPIGGTQSVDLPDGATNGNLNGVFSPNVGAQPAGDYTGVAKINIPNTGGADYDIVFQSPSQAFLSSRVKFFYADFNADTIPGDILVLDGNPLAFQATGAHYTPGTTHELKVELDVTNGEQRYFLDGNLIFTGTVFAGTSVEQAVLFSDNFHLPGEIGRVDDVLFEPGVAGASCFGDVTGDGTVGVADLLSVIGAWGACGSCPQDITGDGTVGVADLLGVIGAWGPCPVASGACCNNGSCTIETFSNCTSAGGTYQGNGSVCSPNPCPQPSPDACASALDVTANIDGAAVQGNNASATPPQNDGGPGDPELPAGALACQWQGIGSNSHNTVWYKFNAVASDILIETCSSSGVSDSILGLFSGSCGSLVELGCGDDDCGGSGFLSRISASGLTIGQTYYVMVGNPGGWTGSTPGNFTLTLATPTPPAGNDVCSGATPISFPFTESVNVSDYTPDQTPGSQSFCVAGSFTMDGSWWYTFTATSNTTVTVSTCASPNEDTLVTAFSGSCAGLIQEACDDDTCTAPAFGGSTFTFPVFAGTTYYLHFETYSGGITGPVSVSITSP